MPPRARPSRSGLGSGGGAPASASTSRGAADAARRPPRARRCSTRSSGAARALGPARHARRRAGDRQEPARLRAVRGGRAHRSSSTGVRAVAALRRGRQLLGARRDGQGAHRHPRDGRRGTRPTRKLRDRRGGRRPTTTSNGPRPLRPLAASRTSGPAESQDEAFAAWRRFFEGVADEPARPRLRGPPLGGRRLLDFVDHLVDWATRVPLLVVAPRGRSCSRRSGWGGGKTNALTLSLAPLSGNETAELVHALLDRRELPPTCRRPARARRGNPLYAEEFVRLLEERADDACLPRPSTASSRAARRAPRREGAASGRRGARKVFWIGGVTRRSRSSCTRSSGGSSSAERRRRSNETEYAFRHPRPRRRLRPDPDAAQAEKHRVAEWIESLAGDR